MVPWDWRVLLHSPSSNNNRILRREVVDITYDHVSIAQTETVLSRGSGANTHAHVYCLSMVFRSTFSPYDKARIISRVWLSVTMVSTTLLERSVPEPVTDHGLSEQLVHHTLHLRTEIYTQSTALLDMVQTLDSDTTPIPCHRAHSEHKFTWARLPICRERVEISSQVKTSAQFVWARFGHS